MSGVLIVLLLLGVAGPVIADELITGTIYARQGKSQLEVPEPSRWEMYAKELKQERDEKDTRISDLKALLEKALKDLENTRLALERMTAERDQLKSTNHGRRSE